MTEQQLALLMALSDAVISGNVDSPALFRLKQSAQPPAEPKPSASSTLENKDAEIAAVIRDNDEKMVEIERLKAERLALRAKLADPRNPDIEAAAKRLEKIDVPFSVFHHNYGMASHVGRLTDVGRLAVARAILTREPG